MAAGGVGNGDGRGSQSLLPAVAVSVDGGGRRSQWGLRPPVSVSGKGDRETGI